jgi:hypothetical protein
MTELQSLDGRGSPAAFPDPALSEISNDLERLSSLLTHIVSLSMRVGGFDDGPELRENIQADVRSILSSSQSAKTTLLALKQRQVPSVDDYIARFDSIRARMQRELPEVINKLRNTGSFGRSSSSDLHADSMTQPLLDQTQLDGETEMLDVLGQQVNQIIAQMREIHEIFHQTLTEIQQQRHFVTSIDSATSKAAESMEHGNKELDEAAEKQKTSTRCLCVIVTIVVLVVIAVVMVVLYETVWHKK